MTNEEFIKRYGIKEMKDIIDSTYIRLSLLRMNKIIRGFKIDKRRKSVILSYKGKILKYEIAKIFFISDDKLLSLLNKSIDNKMSI